MRNKKLLLTLCFAMVLLTMVNSYEVDSYTRHNTIEKQIELDEKYEEISSNKTTSDVLRSKSSAKIQSDAHISAILQHQLTIRRGN